MSRSKVNEFLERARQVSKESEKIEKSMSPVINKRTHTPSVTSYNSSSPLSKHSFISTNEESPKESMKKKVLTGLFNKPKTTKPILQKKFYSEQPSKDNVSKFEEMIKKFTSTRAELNRDLEIHEKFENKVLDNLVVSLKLHKQILSSDPKIKEVDEKNNKKLQQIVQIFRSEALKMDSKLQNLRQENQQLKEILNSPQLASTKSDRTKSLKQILTILSITSSSNSSFSSILSDLCSTYKKISKSSQIENTMTNWFDCLRLSEKNLNPFLSALSKKLIEEQQKRLRSEEEAGKMMDYEEKIIQDLEEKIRQATIIQKSSLKSPKFLSS
ncbi:hypothetical protein SteCoe_119 [Stentor coeruleus]|uniref:Uncharacterized protein n=1 Tax=Stentor coeruleus TaxID=5963 RepID=A0A1R2D529_9CILI|nr:hypothetical protein SteCoe_119 [Stentor coeruleus]